MWSVEGRGGGGRYVHVCGCMDVVCGGGEGEQVCVEGGGQLKINYHQIYWWFPVISAETIQLPPGQFGMTICIHTTYVGNHSNKSLLYITS